MNNQDYQKNILLELMNLEEFQVKKSQNDSDNQINVDIINSPSKATSIDQIEDFLKNELLKLNINKQINLVEGNKNSKILFFYGIFRFTVEFVRIPDAHIGYIYYDWVTMGHLLSIPMILLGVVIMYRKVS